MNRWVRQIFFSVLFFSCAGLVQAGEGIVTYPVEKAAVRSAVFQVTVDGKDVFTQAFKDIHYLRFAQRTKVWVKIACAQKISRLQISPQKDISGYRQTGDTITFRLDMPGYHVVTINDSIRLFVLADGEKALKAGTIQPGWISILQYGVDTTGGSLCTAQIQRALNETAQKKQTLYFPAGTYKTGTLSIPGNASVYVCAGALIKGSADRRDYPVDAGRRESDEVNDKAHYTDNGEWMTFSRLLLIDNAANVRLWGAGIIDGSGSLLRPQGKPANLIRIRNSRNISIEGLLLRDPACWNTHILHSDSVVIRDVKMINDRSVANTDGFDPDASKNVLIDHCFAYCSDDNVAVKSSNNGGLLRNCEDVTINDCVFLTKKSSLKLGTETKAALMQRISFLNNYVVEADRGLVLYCYDGATFRNIRFVNNYFENGYPDNQRKTIHFQIRNRGGEGRITDVLIKDCTFSKAFHVNSEMSGLDSVHTIGGIRLKNVRVDGKPCLTPDDLHLKTNTYVQKIDFEK